MKERAHTNIIDAYTSIDLQLHLENVISSYNKNGVIILKNYLAQQNISALLNEIEMIQTDAERDIRENWNNEIVSFYSKNPAVTVSKIKEYVTEPYFQLSSQKAHVFYENINQTRVINRIGHGMHLLKKYTQMQDTVYHNLMLQTILKGLGYKKPICHLSVYIPKYPHGAGSEVRPHQESTFAYTEPTSVQVLWLALENASISNACMYGILGSHHWPLKWLSKVDHVKKTRDFIKLNDLHIPEFSINNPYYTPLEVKAGDALLFHGNFIHCSPVNTSTQSRRAISFQFIETANTHYPETNWLQPRNNLYLY